MKSAIEDLPGCLGNGTTVVPAFIRKQRMVDQIVNFLVVDLDGQQCQPAPSALAVQLVLEAARSRFWR